ncbi:hypothetical protein GCM10008967_28230 [Bacillus carboniphilus]|uniref:Uncharacterized protein n=1 Tax=Bacillus carboniphilus TaxID=86663 RepID=A0ABN0WG21_9BACI
MRKSILYGLIFLAFLIAASNSVLAQEVSLPSADDFYKNNVDKKVYEEFDDSKLNVRKLTKVKDLPNVFNEEEWKNYPNVWKQNLKDSVIVHTKDLNPEEQVYYFFSIKDDGEKIYIKDAMYNAKTKKISSHGQGHWTKEEFKKFEQN